MTLPIERTNAVVEMEQLVLEVCRILRSRRPNNKTIKVDRELLEAMQSRLRHYPTKYDIERTAEVFPELWG